MNTTFLEYVVFFAASLMMIGGAIGVIAFKNPVHAALGLVLTLFGVAVQFVAQEAHFLAAVQVIVYAGAIVVLFLFVIMLLGVDRAGDISVEPIRIQRPLAAVMMVGLVGLVTAAVLKAGDAIGTLNPGLGLDGLASSPDGRTAGPGDGNIKQLAQNLYNDHVFAFELTSVLLIVAVVATVLMTRKWPKAETGTTS
jgi:NADH-quinone oxidoreductase subunit J